MNKSTKKCGAAGLRRSAIVERIRLREEWSALKEIPDEQVKQRPNTKTRKQLISNTVPKSQKKTVTKVTTTCDKSDDVNEALRGVVVLVEVGSEPRALALRAALAALGASVVPAWSPLVTHLVWTQGGCRSTRARARALGCRLVSPLWVEACAARGERLPERVFPAPARPSDLPSPATLRKFLIRAEIENIPLHDLLSDSPDGAKRPLRLSSDTSRDTHDTSRDTHDTSNDTSRDTSRDTRDTSHDATDIESRVNTAPRRRAAQPQGARRPGKSKRKLFTQKEPELQTTDDDTDDETAACPKQIQPTKMTQQNRKDLAKAERLARRLMGAVRNTHRPTLATQHSRPPRIVLTGMSRTERHEAWLAIKQLNGKVQQHVDKKTTHVVMGSCHEPEDVIDKTAAQSPKTTKQSPRNKKQSLRTKRQSPRTNKQSPINTKSSIAMCNKCNSPEKILSQMFTTNVSVENYSKRSKNDRRVICNCECDISGVKNISDTSDSNNLEFPIELRCDNNNMINLNSNENAPNNAHNESIDILGSGKDNGRNNILNRDTNDAGRNISNHDAENDQNIDFGPERETMESNNVLGNEQENGPTNLESVVKLKPRTVNVLLGAARGCRVLRLEWITDSLKANRWLNHIGYEVRHLKKISQKARVERSALNKIHTEYGYNVFKGMRVKITPDADQRTAIAQLLTLCGAVIPNDDQTNVQNAQNDQDIQKSGKKGSKLKFSDLIARMQSQRARKNVQQCQNGRQIGAHTQNGGADFDLTVGKEKGEVSSKWVFDSVAAARMRTTRRYIND